MNFNVRLLALLLFLAFNFPSSAQQIIPSAQIDQEANISLDETIPLTDQYKADATPILNLLGDKSDALIEILSDQNMDFKLNKTTKELEIKILKPISINQEWTVSQWNDFLHQKMKRALATLK